MSKRGGLPKWAFQHVQKCRDAFGIGAAGFLFTVARADVVDGEPDTAGSATTSARYQRGGITLRRDLTRSEDSYDLLTHETLHAAMGAQRQALSRIIELVPADLQGHAEELWADGNEATVTQLARALTPCLRAMQRRPE